MTSEPSVAPQLNQRSPALTVVDRFLPPDLALAMRSDIDRHFSDPYRHRADTHQVWNYWFVPQAYTYFRTQPEKVIQRANVERFLGLLQAWTTERLGLARISWPYLSLYVSGCRQGLHNDARNGRFAFVYSLTRDERRSTGGETLMLPHGDPFLRNMQKAGALTAFHELVEPRFNRLVVFDDRMVHGVQLVEGAMDPADARFVLHGHIEESAPIVAGTLPPAEVLQGLRAPLELFDRELGTQARHYHGPLVLRFAISPQGRVGGLRVILDRAFAEHEAQPGWSAIKERLLAMLAGAAFPASSAETGVTLPLSIGGPVRPDERSTPRN